VPTGLRQLRSRFLRFLPLAIPAGVPPLANGEPHAIPARIAGACGPTSGSMLAEGELQGTIVGTPTVPVARLQRAESAPSTPFPGVPPGLACGSPSASTAPRRHNPTSAESQGSPLASDACIAGIHGPAGVCPLANGEPHASPASIARIHGPAGVCPLANGEPHASPARIAGAYRPPEPCSLKASYKAWSWIVPRPLLHAFSVPGNPRPSRSQGLPLG
jgi:hypothetical protein